MIPRSLPTPLTSGSWLLALFQSNLKKWVASTPEDPVSDIRRTVQYVLIGWKWEMAVWWFSFVNQLVFIYRLSLMLYYLLQSPKFHSQGITIFQFFLQVFLITEKCKYGCCWKPLLMEAKSALLLKLLWPTYSTWLKSLHRSYFIKHPLFTRKVWQEYNVVS